MVFLAVWPPCLLPAFTEPLGLVRLQFPDQSIFLWSAEATLPIFLGLKFVGIIPYVTGLACLNAWSFPWRAVAGAVATSLPIFFAGMVFATSFKRSRDASGALAANMFGALIGGMLEYVSMATGIHRLTLLALILYGLSWFALAFRGWRMAWDTA